MPDHSEDLQQLENYYQLRHGSISDGLSGFEE